MLHEEERVFSKNRRLRTGRRRCCRDLIRLTLYKSRPPCFVRGHVVAALGHGEIGPWPRRSETAVSVRRPPSLRLCILRMAPRMPIALHSGRLTSQRTSFSPHSAYP
eukprot:2023451-Pleurochrysis_carterae.AAC.3